MTENDSPLGAAAQAPSTPKDIEKQQSPSDSPQKKSSAFKNLGLLDRFLAVWIFLAMAIGIILGNFVPSTGPALQRGKFVGVSVPIAVGLLVMMYPILCKVRFESLHQVFKARQIWIQIAFSIFVNWIIAPFFMVLIWTGLAGGDGEYCAILVAVNSLLQMVLFAPMGVFFIQVISGDTIAFQYSTAAKSVAVFLGIPLGAAILTRFTLRWATSPRWYDEVFLKWASPWSLIGLLFTILVLFASQGRHVVHQIVSVIRVAAPLIVYFAVIFLLTLLITYKLGFGYKLAVTQSFTAASNNFELAIAVAVATFGADSNQALASTVGPLIEVPVLLGLVYVVKFIAERLNWKD
ncbi:hypothetical protein AbraIFM66951_011856 [Aspergillus brasiliensis]|uniref:Arsenical-resistance protein n=1 Tax=Aspergillus brasiliensis TaxID=319629 RepID=A0A9W6DRT5_9EURO|nr:hypothetical protein AbraCBS73388_011726 [Aspergillus brasiliensis]GKZ48101.1 hypothetical protein AbraIFM66951_011856 [Aspergillus brasiliensis]